MCAYVFSKKKKDNKGYLICKTHATILIFKSIWKQTPLILIKIYFGGYLVLSNSEASANREHTSLYTFSLNFLRYTQIGQRAPYRFCRDSASWISRLLFFPPSNFLKLRALSKQRWLANPRDTAERDRWRQRSPSEGRRTYIACGFLVQLVSDVTALYCSGSTAKAGLSQLVVLTVFAGKYVIHYLEPYVFHQFWLCFC